MTHILDKYRRVSEEEPCPKCGRPDWCLLRNDGLACVCSRLSSGKPFGEAGWLHYLPKGAANPSQGPRKQKVYLSTQQVAQYIESVSGRENDGMLEKQASTLGLSLTAMKRMHGLYDPARAVAAFPMFDANRRPVGCRFRRSDGRKWSLKGGREGVFLSRLFDPQNLIVVVEGPTDAAALVYAGIENVIGRPNCTGGTHIISCLLCEYTMTPVMILSDPDTCGLDGATKLANILPNPTVVICGPTDVREFIVSGAWTQTIDEAIIECLGDPYDPLWAAEHYNTTGRFFPFLRHYKVAA